MTTDEAKKKKVEYLLYAAAFFLLLNYHANQTFSFYVNPMIVPNL